MKKLLSVVLALVLVVSMVVVVAEVAPASPVRADPGETYYVDNVTGADTNTAAEAKSPLTPWKTIQWAVDNVSVQDGDTIAVDNGTYTENITIITPGLRLVSMYGSGNCTIQATDNNTVVISANRTTLGRAGSGFTIKGATNHYGVKLDSAFNCKIDSDNITGNKYGIWVNGNNNTIQRNLISGNTIGIRLPGTTGHNQVWYNNIVGNTKVTAGLTNYGVYGLPVPGDPHRKQWAGFNYWGSPSGPGEAGPGTGDNVNEYVWYNPWLNKTFSEILADGIADISMGIPLGVGWNTLSTPLALTGDNNSWAEIVSHSDLQYLLAASHNSTGFFYLTDEMLLEPLDAVLLKMSSDNISHQNIVTLKISTANNPPPTRDLEVGWNLIGASMAITSQELEMWQVLKTVETTPDGLIGYDMVVSPPLATQPSWVYVRGQETVEVATFEWEKMRCGRAYWIYMENADEMAGFGSTPITAKIWD